MKNFIRIFTLNLAALLLIHCSGGGSGTTSVGNPSTSTTTPTITIGQLVADTSPITIPLAVIGSSEADVATTSLAIYRNGDAYTTLPDLTPYFSTSVQQVRFNMSALAADDLLTFVFSRANAVTASHTGRVSATADTTTISSVAETDLLADANISVQVLDASSFRLTIEEGAFSGGVDASDTVEVTQNFSSETAPDDVTTYNALDGYDATTGAVTIDVSGVADNIYVLTAALNAESSQASLEMHFSDTLGVYDSTTTLHFLGLTGTGEGERSETFILNETYSAASEDCPSALQPALDGEELSIFQSDGQLTIYGVGDDDDDYNGVIDADGTFHVLSGMSATSETDAEYEMVYRFDGMITDGAVSGTYVIAYDHLSGTCRFEIGFVGEAE